MPQFVKALNEEIRRLARKEVRAQVRPLKKITAQYRREIAALKRQLQAVGRDVTRVRRGAGKAAGPAENTGGGEGLSGVRFSARSVKAQRAKLGLSAAAYGKLVGVSGLTIYHWEQGKSRPRQRQLSGLVAVRNIGRREALRRLES